MARKKKKNKAQPDYSSKLAQHGIYATSTKKPSKKAAIKANAAQSSATRKATEKGKKMAEIELYAKQNKVTITQAMIHFM